MALTSIQRSGVHMEVHLALSELLGPNPKDVLEDSDRGREIKQAIHDHYQANKGENTDLGIEMDHRHKSCVYPPSSESDVVAPEWSPECYHPSTAIGSRAPHVYLQDGRSIFDLYGKYWTLFQFVDSSAATPTSLIAAADAINMPLKHVVLSDEVNARKVWQKSLVLVRPDGHVAWRGEKAPSADLATEIVNCIAGHNTVAEIGENHNRGEGEKVSDFAAVEKTGTQVGQYELEKMGAMQA